MKPIINFTGYQIKNLKYSRNSSLNISEENEVTRKVSIGLTDDKKNGLVILEIEITDNKQRSFELELAGEFEISNETDESEIENALSVNGVAILYPYARSIISVMSTLDASSAIVLPTINTTI